MTDIILSDFILPLINIYSYYHYDIVFYILSNDIFPSYACVVCCVLKFYIREAGVRLKNIQINVKTFLFLLYILTRSLFIIINPITMKLAPISP